MPITVVDVTYVCGKKAKDPINVQCPTRGTWQIFKRHVNETDSQMQRRIGERFAKDIVAEMEAVAASRSVEPASTTPTSSKASVGSKHKPSPPDTEVWRCDAATRGSDLLGKARERAFTSLAYVRHHLLLARSMSTQDATSIT